MDMSNKYTTTIQQYENTDDYFIEIPDEICQELGWKEGDEIDWQIDDKGITIVKVKDCSSTQTEHQETNYNWHTVKENHLQEYYSSESEGKDFSFNKEKEGSRSITH